jgi:hypothetical protein
MIVGKCWIIEKQFKQTWNLVFQSCNILEQTWFFSRKILEDVKTDMSTTSRWIRHTIQESRDIGFSSSFLALPVGLGGRACHVQGDLNGGLEFSQWFARVYTKYIFVDDIYIYTVFGFTMIYPYELSVNKDGEYCIIGKIPKRMVIQVLLKIWSGKVAHPSTGGRTVETNGTSAILEAIQSWPFTN